MSHDRRTIRLAAVLLLLASLAAGCARLSPVAPETGPASTPAPAEVATDDTVPPPPGVLSVPTGASADLTLPIVGPLLSVVWTKICEKFVPAGRVEVVKANRYELTFAKGSLRSDITCTVQEYDQNVLDIQLGPHGTKFLEPVTLSIDFSGTAADPHSAIADGCEPVLWWWNDGKRRWEEVPGRTDWAARRHIVRLEHFSRYVVGGKAGWKQEPLTETE